MPKKRASFHVDAADWNKFKQICKNQGSNASTELRRFIKIYNKFYDQHKKNVKTDFFSYMDLDI